MSFENYYAEKYKEIEDELLNIIEKEENENLRDLLNFALGGKHFRGVLTLLLSDILNADKEKALRNACIVELVHQASLVHDDVIDLDVIRRGKPALWTVASDIVKGVIKDKFLGIEHKIESTIKLFVKRKSIPIAVLTGDVLLMKAMEIADEEVRNEAIKVVSKMLSGVCYEVKKDENRYYYFKCIEGKTASLFRFSAWLAWIASDKPNYPVSEFGQKLGILYQLVDDYCDDELPDFIDLTEIKKTYNEVLSLIEKMPKNEYTEILEEVPDFMIRKLASESGKEDEIINIIKK